MNTRVARHFATAKSMAAHSPKRRIKIGAVIAIKNNTIALGCNSDRSHTMQKRYNRFRRYRQEVCIHEDTNYIHAEMDALNRAKKLDLSKAAIYVYREGTAGDLLMCKPCEACMQAIKDAGIRHVYYTSPEGYNHLELQ